MILRNRIQEVEKGIRSCELEVEKYANLSLDPYCPYDRDYMMCLEMEIEHYKGILRNLRFIERLSIEAYILSLIIVKFIV